MTGLHTNRRTNDSPRHLRGYIITNTLIKPFCVTIEHLERNESDQKNYEFRSQEMNYCGNDITKINK